MYRVGTFIVLLEIGGVITLMLESFVILCCIPIPITLVLFIGFFLHMSNGWKAQEVNYEFVITSFLVYGCLCGQNCSFLPVAPVYQH